MSFIYERDLADEVTMALIVESVLGWRRRLGEKLDAAAVTRPALQAVDRGSLADHIFTVIEGAFLLGRELDESDTMAAQLAHLRTYLELLLEAPVRG